MWRSDTPGAAFDALLPEALGASARHQAWQPGDEPMPSLFLSHGAPPLFDDGPWMAELLTWSLSLPKPRGVVIVSAHWETAPLAISAHQAPLVYDFGGFASRYYTMQYATPDAGWLAERIMAAMPETESVHQHTTRGLDHGAWVPLKVMLPMADIPVFQVSIPTHDPQRLMELGRRLRPLRDEGILIIGSGFMTHGLPFLTGDMVHGNSVPAWSSEFDHWAWEAAAALDVDSLATYRNAPGMPYAHPTPEHFSPLFVTIGAADDGVRPDTSVDGFMWGLAKRSMTFAAASV